MTIEEDSPILYNKIIEENELKGFQTRLTVSEFKDVTYIQLRKYFLSYEGEWMPSKEGISIPLSIENSYALLDGLLDILSQSEGEELISEYFSMIKENNGSS